MAEPPEPHRTWVFLSNHAHVLLCIARNPDSRTRDIAEQVNMTGRAAHRIVSDLIAEGYLTRTKIGRRNRYEVNRHGHLRTLPFATSKSDPCSTSCTPTTTPNNPSAGPSKRAGSRRPTAD